jgi:hypothetical protein
MTHLNLAALDFARGERERAAKLLRRTQSTLKTAGIVLDPDAFEVDCLGDSSVSRPAMNPEGLVRALYDAFYERGFNRGAVDASTSGGGRAAPS